MRHQGWNIDLAVKSPKPEIVAAAGGVESFEREAETWVNLGLHPHTVSCYYVRRIESSPLVFAEYVAGGSLQDWIESRRLYTGGSLHGTYVNGEKIGQRQPNQTPEEAA